MYSPSKTISVKSGNTFSLFCSYFNDNGTSLKKLNNKDYKGANNEFLKWNKSGGKVLQGLVNRRKDEREVFLK